jgi:hypothetical protein
MNWGVKSVTKKHLDQARLLLISEVEAYDRYLRGEIYGFVVNGPDGELADSCWGFDSLDYCKEQATKSAKSAAQEYGAEHNA